jgi:hypothetical protein
MGLCKYQIKRECVSVCVLTSFSYVKAINEIVFEWKLSNFYGTLCTPLNLSMFEIFQLNFAKIKLFPVL